MKNKWNILLLMIYLVTAVLCAVNWLNFLDLPSFFLPFIPSFCSQLLLCRVTRSGWLWALPVLPVLILLGLAAYYLVWGSGWDLLAALLFGCAAIAPAVGIAAGWGVWYLAKRKKRKVE